MWVVETKDEGYVLGVVKWFGRWRCYAYFPYPETVYEKDCLREIALWCEERTKEHMAKKRAERNLNKQARTAYTEWQSGAPKEKTL